MRSRRRWRRLSIMALGQIQVKGERKTQEAYVANLSRGGAGIYLHRPIRVGTPLLLSYTFTDRSGQVQQHTRHGKVVWCRRFGAVYAMGIQFDTPVPP